MEVNDDFVSLREYKGDEESISKLCDAGIKKKICIFVISIYTSKLITLQPSTIQTLLSIYPERKEVYVWAKYPSQTNQSLHKYTGIPIDEKQPLTCHDFWVKKADAEVILEKPVLEEDMDPRERTSMLRLILGMAVGGYGYTPYSSRDSASGEKRGSIYGDLYTLNIPVSDGTIRKYLVEAEEKCKRDLSKKGYKTLVLEKA